MEAQQKQQSTDHRETWVEHAIDMLPFIFAIFVILLVTLAMMTPQAEPFYTNVVNAI